jgi:putative ABC transport system permease protein
MNFTNLKYIYRQLIRKKYYTLLNILGLGIGLGCAMLMATYLIHEFSFDRYHSKAKELYRIVEGNNCETPYVMGQTFKNEIPEIKNVARFYNFSEIQIIHKQEHFLEKDMIMADSTILSMLDFEIIMGRKGQLLTNKNEIIISETIAQKYFPKEDPIGKALKIRLISHEIDYTVSGVFKNLPTNSSLQTGIITNIEYAFDLLDEIEYAIGSREKKANTDYQNKWGKEEFSTIVQIGEGANLADIARKCSKIATLHQEDKHIETITLQPFTDIYLKSGEYRGNSMFKTNQLSSLKIFMAIGILILFVACINFILISNADLNQSVVEIACRKVNGASQMHIMYISLLKSCLIAFVSLIPAILFVELSLPVFNNLFQKELNAELLLQWPYLVSIFSITLITGIAAGVYLGFFVSNVSPARLIQNKGFSVQNKGRLKGSLVIVQFIAFMLLVISFMFMQKQYNYSLKKDIGVNTKNVKVVWFNDEKVRSNAQIVYNELLTDPNVQSCVLTSFMTPPTDNVLNISYRDKATGNYTQLEGLVLGVGELELLNIKLLKGESFTQSNTQDKNNILINEAAAKLFKVEAGDNISSFKVVGIVSNFHFHSLHQPVSPIVILSQTSNFYNLLIKTNGNNTAVEKHLNQICQTISPGFSYESEMLGDRVVKFYEREEKQIGTIASFSVIALGLSIMGLLGFVSITLNKRTKEIGIRKINGGSIKDILNMFYLQYIRWITLAFVIACPIAWYAMHKWLENFAYKTSLSWWVFATAGAIALFFTLLTVSWQSWRAANKNPVESLRYE